MLKEKNIKLERQDIIPVLVIGFIGNFVNQVCFIVGVSNTTAGNSSLIMASLPIVVAAINGLFNLEKISRKALAGIIISFVGIVIVVVGTGQRINLKDQYFFGNMVIFGGIISWAAYSILNKKYLEKYSPLKLTAYGLLSGLVVMAAIWYKPLVFQEWGKVSFNNYLIIIYSGLCSITLGTIFWNMGLRKVGSTRTSLYNNITPIVSVILGILLLGESFKLLQGFGAIMIFTGLTITRRSKENDKLPGKGMLQATKP